ncbi:MAG: hypothetical protein B7Z78_03360 [Rhodospirillales bacterium 20-60-12]|nr:MAG: hypothetical protein B7Z78_03360 [Rhodospirillales bacterium 20-60-12]
MSASSGTSNIMIPTFLQPNQPGDVVGFNLQNPLTTPLAAQDVSFAQTFQAGAVPAGDQLVAIINGVSQAVQMDVKTTNADGSVASAVLTIAQPALAAGSSDQVMLALAPSGTIPGGAIDLAAALNNYALSVAVTAQNAGGTATTYNIDAVAALKAALANGTASFWQQGPLATQARVDVPVTGSFHLVFDITAYQDGSFSADVGFHNDLAMGAVGGAITYSETITQNNVVASQQTNLTQYQYQNWNTTIYSKAAPGVNIQHDTSYLEKIGAVQNYDLTTNISALVAGETTQMAAAGFAAPLGTAGVTQYMPTTGGRADIGPVTQGNTAWLMTQNEAAAQYALDQANASGSVPWNMILASNPSTDGLAPSGTTGVGQPLTTADYPNLWTDSRGGPGSYTTGLVQQVDPTNSGWTADGAHQPDLAYVAYLQTGNRQYLDALNAQASYAVTDYWPASIARNAGDGNVIQGNQIRGAAWSLREIQEAAWANPDGSVMKAYFTQIMNNNYAYLISQLPVWSQQEGQTAGYILPGAYPGGGLPTWEQAYFSSTVTLAAEQGNQQAIEVMKWQANFFTGLFLNANNGFNPHDGAAYELALTNSAGVAATSWAQLEGNTVASGISNGTGWAHSQGDFAQLSLESLAGLITVQSQNQSSFTSTDAARAIQAYAYLISSGAPFVGQSDQANSPMFDIVPRLADGQLLTDTDLLISSDTTATSLGNAAQNSDMLIAAGSGNDTLIGGSGINILQAGTGADTLIGGGNGNYLFAGSGNDVLIAGGGVNFMQSGTGVTTFLSNTTSTTLFQISNSLSGADEISGFVAGSDHLVITDANFTALTSAAIAALIAGATEDASGNAVLHLSPTETVTLDGVAVTALTSNMFASTVSGNPTRNLTTPGNQTVTGGALPNELVTTGPTSNVTYLPQGGSGTIVGGGGNNNFTLDGTGNYTVIASAGINTVNATIGQDVMSLAGGSNLALLNSNANSVNSAGQDTIHSYSMNDTILASGNALIGLASASSFNQVSVSGAASVVINGTSSNIVATGASVEIIGGSQNMISVSGAGTVSAGGQANSIMASAGVIGLNAGSNMLTVTGSADYFAESNDNSVVGGASGFGIVDGTNNQISVSGGVVFDRAGTNQVNASGNADLFITGNLATMVNITGNVTVSAPHLSVQDGANTINAVSGNALVFGEAANFVLIGGTGQDIIVGGTGAITAMGGSGSLFALGGSAGGNLLTGGAGQVTLIGGGTGDVLQSGQTGINFLIAGSGNETLSASNMISGAVAMNAGGAGSNTDMVGGTSVNEFTAGAGAATMTGGASAGLNLFNFGVGPGGGTDLVQNYRPGTDQLAFNNGVSIAGSSVVGGNLALTLSDGTRVTLQGITSLPAAVGAAIPQ